jgi:hypothetical protein
MDEENRTVNFLELGNRLENEFILMRDVKLVMKYPYLKSVACMVYSALEIGAAKGLYDIGVEELGAYLLLLREEDSVAESVYYYCAEFLDSKRGG